MVGTPKSCTTGAFYSWPTMVVIPLLLEYPWNQRMQNLGQKSDVNGVCQWGNHLQFHWSLDIPCMNFTSIGLFVSKFCFCLKCQGKSQQHIRIQSLLVISINGRATYRQSFCNGRGLQFFDFAPVILGETWTARGGSDWQRPDMGCQKQKDMVGKWGRTEPKRYSLYFMGISWKNPPITGI